MQFEIKLKSSSGREGVPKKVYFTRSIIAIASGCTLNYILNSNSLLDAER